MNDELSSTHTHTIRHRIRFVLTNPSIKDKSIFPYLNDHLKINDLFFGSLLLSASSLVSAAAAAAARLCVCVAMPVRLHFLQFHFV